MNRISTFMILAVPAILLAACTGSTFQKTPGGMPYQVFRSTETQQAKAGDFLKVHLTQKINDSVYFTTGNRLPIYIPIGQQTQSYDISEVWTKLHAGDSVVATQMMDTFLKRMPAGNLPPEFKKGDRIITFVKVLSIFSSDSLKQIDEKKETAAYAAREASELEQFIGANMSKVQKTVSGAYVEIIQDGEGEAIRNGNFVSLNYSGATLAGKKFDSNTDTAFHHVEPLRFTVGVGQMIKGLDEAVLLAKKGSIVKVYIPSTLGYGATPPPGAPIKPYEHLVFDFVVLDVQETAPGQPTVAPAQH